MYDVAVIGGGPAGINAALYLKRAGVDVVLVERGLMGGQLNNTEVVENYLGAGSVKGHELASTMEEHMLEAGVEKRYMNVKGISDLGVHFELDGGRKKLHARRVVLATGVKHKDLGVEGEQDLKGSGISNCAVCDANFFKGKDVAVIGGGDAAFEEGRYLSNICNSVTLLYHGREFWRAKEDLVERYKDEPNTEYLMGFKTVSFSKDLVPERIAIEGADGNGVIVDGVFIYVGVQPVNELALSIGSDVDEAGYVLVNDKFETTYPGVYAIGDLIHPDFKQIAVAVGDGAFVSKYVKESLED